MDSPEISDILQAHTRIKKYIHNTPIHSSTRINRITGAELFFKCENFQKVGAFKARGATNAVLSLPDTGLRNGVATHSSGNHAAALAFAANIKNTKAYIVMNETAPPAKKNAVRDYGARITFSQPDETSRKQTLDEVVKDTQAQFIHPYNNTDIISGQGTVGIEILQSVPPPDILITPVGGGGLLSGTAISVKNISPDTKVIGAEPYYAKDAYESFYSGSLKSAYPPKTIADGLLTSLSEKTFSIISNNVDNIYTVSEENIIYAMRLIWERMKIVTEPSAAVPLGAIIQHSNIFKDKRIAIILSGGNVDVASLPFY